MSACLGSGLRGCKRTNSLTTATRRSSRIVTVLSGVPCQRPSNWRYATRAERETATWWRLKESRATATVCSRCLSASPATFYSNRPMAYLTQSVVPQHRARRQEWSFATYGCSLTASGDVTGRRRRLETSRAATVTSSCGKASRVSDHHKPAAVPYGEQGY